MIEDDGDIYGDGVNVATRLAESEGRVVVRARERGIGSDG
jgi:hypothetical protein